MRRTQSQEQLGKKDSMAARDVMGRIAAHIGNGRRLAQFFKKDKDDEIARGGRGGDSPHVFGFRYFLWHSLQLSITLGHSSAKLNSSVMAAAAALALSASLG